MRSSKSRSRGNKNRNLRPSGGNIVNLITEHVKEGHYLTGRRGLGYDCAKFAQWRLTAVLAAELKADNIRVNGLCFGATDTPMPTPRPTETPKA